MKKIAAFFCVLAIIIVGLAITYYFLKEKGKVQPVTVTVAPAKKVSSDQFAWGVFTNPYVFNIPKQGFVKENVDKQIPIWKDLGINTIRFNYEFGPADPKIILPENDYFVNKMIANNIAPYMVIESPYIPGEFIEKSTQQDGYDWGKFIAGHFKGRVKYYQLLNEVDGTAIKKDYPGFNPDDYDETKYQAVKNFLLGLSKAIKETDPAAQRVVNSHWVGTAMIDRLMKDGVDFEIIGWDWFSDMGTDMTAVKPIPSKQINIIDYFKNSGKKFWISELNKQDGTMGNKEADQASFFEQTIQNAQKSGRLSGVFIFPLFDTTAFDNGKETTTNTWGLVQNVQTTQNIWGPGKKKKAYNTYKDLIARFLAGI
ncbi:MAG: hypothetical protein NTZ65_03100 [Candidatus Berkelbacteria bacterium]|nr:hypothetical protein [Candidatus Berkelbacteria bacterium]